MKKFRILTLVFTISLSLFGTVNSSQFLTAVFAEETSTPVLDEDLEEYATIPVNRTVNVNAQYASPEKTVLGYCEVNIKGSFNRGSNYVSNVDLNYSYSAHLFSFSSGTISMTHFSHSYETYGDKLYIILNVTMKVVNNGDTTYISGSKTIVM